MRMFLFKFRKYIHFLFFLFVFVQKSWAVEALPVYLHKTNAFPPCIADQLKTPNAFSPNNDGKNDRFCLEGWESCVSSFQVVIYNRFGEEVFASQSADFCWDGAYHGQVVDSGIYLFVIKATTNDGEIIKISGNITLIK